eukprot:TRINITY_DN6413_c0_g1_i3.p1 TRINITY_DN6413_c0_g1~~TRINITY_DN6413_c0_g1_i3.p1  ORF type:complete len:372 (-),score=43.32 TRINITY_DN6413_c0_g1_i3:24-1139(-)
MRCPTLFLVLLLCGVALQLKDEKLYYRIQGNFAPNHLSFIEEEFKSRGFERTESDEIWDVTWTTHYLPSDFKKIQQSKQVVNSFPGSYYLEIKENLHTMISRAKSRFGDTNFYFWPQTFALNKLDQWTAFRNLYYENPAEPPIFIVKRSDKQRGEGVHLVSSLAEVDQLQTPNSPAFPISKTKPIAQRYIKNVLTLEGFKFTLRVYAVITSIDPLRIYVYPNGLVRLCSKRYELDNLREPLAHVDAFDLNYEHTEEFENFVANTSLIHDGLRCDIEYLLKRLENEGKDSAALWKEIQHVILMSFIAVEDVMWKEFTESACANRAKCLKPFELVGFDLLIDEDLKVHPLTDLMSLPQFRYLILKLRHAWLNL